MLYHNEDNYLICLVLYLCEELQLMLHVVHHFSLQCWERPTISLRLHLCLHTTSQLSMQSVQCSTGILTVKIVQSVSRELVGPHDRGNLGCKVRILIFLTTSLLQWFMKFLTILRVPCRSLANIKLHQPLHDQTFYATIKFSQKGPPKDP